VDTKRSFSHASSRGPHHFIGVGYFPGPENIFGRALNHFLHRGSYRTWFQQYLPAYRSPGSYWIWVCDSPFGVLRSKRDTAQEMET
jgi:hypothetical protein